MEVSSITIIFVYWMLNISPSLFNSSDLFFILPFSTTVVLTVVLFNCKGKIDRYCDGWKDNLTQDYSFNLLFRNIVYTTLCHLDVVPVYFHAVTTVPKALKACLLIFHVKQLTDCFSGIIKAHVYWFFHIRHLFSMKNKLTDCFSGIIKEDVHWFVHFRHSPPEIRIVDGSGILADILHYFPKFGKFLSVDSYTIHDEIVAWWTIWKRQIKLIIEDLGLDHSL